MKKKIAILGSTGSIGKILLDIIDKDKKNFEIILLSANKDYKNLFKQAKKFNVKNLIITNNESFRKLKEINKKSKIKIFNTFKNYDKIFKKKKSLDYVMSSIVGIKGLNPTYRIIKFTKNIAIANKESIICGWNLITNELKKNKTTFIPIDSEHFSIWFGIKNLSDIKIDKIYITASGGPFFYLPLRKFKNINIKKAIKHPNWRMGKKISIDSATMINKVYEVIEAKNIFNIPYNKIDILIHPKSYIHCLLKFNNGLSKIILHDTTMQIPIFNSIYSNSNKSLKSKKINLLKLNDLNFSIVNLKKYPVVNILKSLPQNNSLYETVIVSVNDTLVEMFLDKKIKFTDISKNLLKKIMSKEFLKYKKKIPKNIKEIEELNKYVRSKIKKKVYKS